VSRGPGPHGSAGGGLGPNVRPSPPPRANVHDYLELDENGMPAVAVNAEAALWLIYDPGLSCSLHCASKGCINAGEELIELHVASRRKVVRAA